MSNFDQKVVDDRPSSEFHSAADGRQRTPSAVPSAHLPGKHLRLPPALRADCSRCAGLCCVAPSFYSLQGFAFDKPAHSACRHLTPENRCTIHAERASRGFPGCVAFDCYGAGQRVTQELFNGLSWRENSDTAVEIFSAYTTCVALHRLMALLAISEAIVSPPRDVQIRRKRMQLDELCRSEEAKTGTVDIAAVQNEVLRLVRNGY